MPSLKSEGRIIDAGKTQSPADHSRGEPGKGFFSVNAVVFVFGIIIFIILKSQ